VSSGLRAFPPLEIKFRESHITVQGRPIICAAAGTNQQSVFKASGGQADLTAWAFINLIFWAKSDFFNGKSPFFLDFFNVKESLIISHFSTAPIFSANSYLSR
jgi:hypothetical protein